jgi:hypothetical protein
VASIRVSGPKKDGKTTSAFEALNSEKENIMSIIRHEIRQISDENRGQPIISQAVVHGNIAYFAGITPNPIVGDIKIQTAQVLRRVDELLNLAGSSSGSSSSGGTAAVISGTGGVRRRKGQMAMGLCSQLFVPLLS